MISKYVVGEREDYYMTMNESRLAEQKEIIVVICNLIESIPITKVIIYDNEICEEILGVYCFEKNTTQEIIKEYYDNVIIVAEDKIITECRLEKDRQSYSSYSIIICIDKGAHANE